MSILVESLKRLYSTSQVVKDKVEVLLIDEKITQVEHDYITD